MKLIIGLGNPGEKYEHNRHNAGFIVVDELKKNFSAQGGPTAGWEFNKKFDTEISEGVIKSPSHSPFSKGGIRGILTKPQTFMNKSGDAVRKIMSFYKLTPRDIIIIHDDLDIEVGKYKLSTDTHSVGHKGVEDIIEKLGTQEFKRVRIGVETEGGRQNRKIPGEDFVLQDFSDEEYEKIQELTKDITKEIYSAWQQVH